MTMAWLDHVNIRTARLDEMSEFYEQVLGLKRGKRPFFEFGGAWHYCNGRAIVHLVESTKNVPAREAPVEHFALRSTGSLKRFQSKLRKHDAPYYLVPLESIEMCQVNVFDPDGNKIEVQFHSDGSEDMEPFYGSAKARRRFRKGEELNKTPPLRLSKSKSKVSKTNKKLGEPKPLKAPAARRARKRTAA
ncbi:MAG: VOC family protein [Alphaproteobacteria bacterium]|nr:VOC family protein [Alphaproteobacteria bacterium]